VRTSTPLEQRLERVPDRVLPVRYFVFAHLCLLTAFLAFAVVPRSLAGFFYHPKLLGVVHLVTLGWISASILGALYMILPMALRSPLPAGRLDRWTFWCFAIGVLGIVSHFWIDQASGMVWSAGLVVAALATVGWRVVRSLARGAAPPEHRLPFHLAFGNVLLAGLLGMLIGIDKDKHLLGGFVLDHVAAHAHLAALGWATFMVIGAGYRLLPMFLPAAAPRGRALVLEALVTEIGLLGTVTGIYLGARWTALPGAVFVLGLALFLRRLLWMLANRKPSPRGLVRPDPAMVHVGAAFACLVLAAAFGLWLLLAPESPSTPQVVMVYGVLGLIGFLAQMVVGISVRLLPLYAWMRRFSAESFERLPPSPHNIVRRPLHLLVLILWLASVPLLTWGLALDVIWSIRLAGALLAASIATSLLHLRLLLRAHPTTLVEERP
jgi:hypothetical protein